MDEITMDWWLFTFFLGAILSLFLPIVPVIFYVIIFILLAVILLLINKTRSSSGLMFGCAWLIFSGIQYNSLWQDNQLDVTSFFKKAHVIQGKIITSPSQSLAKSDNLEQVNAALKIAQVDGVNILDGNNRSDIKNTSFRFNFMVTRVDDKELNRPFKIRLRWDKTSYQLYQGQQWRIKVKIKPSHGFANLGGFSYQTWLRQKQLVATGYVRNHQQNLLLDNEISLRQSLLNKSISIIPKDNLSPLLLALGFGERSKISEKLWLVLQTTGTQHLIAISGLHLGLVASGTFFITLFFLKILPLSLMVGTSFKQQLLTYNLRLLAIGFSCCIALYYAYLAGFSLPTIRALVMLLLYWFTRLLGVKFGIIRWLLVAIFCITILAPSSLFSGSFWLSAYAVSIIFLVVWRASKQLSSESRIGQWLKSLLIIQISLSLLMLPISALFNHQLSIVALFANLMAVPLMSFTSIPLCLFAVLVLPFSDTVAKFIFELALLSIKLVWQWLEYLTLQSWAVVSVSTWQIILLSIVIALFAFGWFLSINRRLLSPVTLMIILLTYGYHRYHQSQQNWQVSIMDVGQGLSIIVERNQHAILYDTGASYPSGFNLVEAVVVPYLAHQGLSHLDKVIISHSDNDHAGGLDKLRKLVSIDDIIVNDITLNGDSLCLQGQWFQWQGLTFSMLWPNSGRGENNDDSCVMRISDGKYSVLLTGDISVKVEKQLLIDKNTLEQLHSNVIVAPHHGSKTSSSDSFIQKVSPEYVIFSAGFLNQWHMPATTVVNRYKDNNVTIFNTAENGMVQLDIHPDGIHVKPYRQYFWPYWFAN